MRRLAAAARVARLATTDPSGRVQLVPICFVLAGERLYSAVDDKPKRTRELARLRNVRANPAVTVLVDHYEEDWSALWWVRLHGRARVLEAGEERERALDLLTEKYPQYREQRPRGAVLAVELETLTGWSSSDTPVGYSEQ